MFRQGDVLIIPVKSVPKKLTEIPREDGRVILAHGEVTGHAHAIHSPRVTMFREDGSGAGLYLIANGPAEIVHEEHATVALPKGLYEVRRQVEYTPEAVRNVAD